MRIRVYVCSPISLGDVSANVRTACEAGYRLLKAGYAPIIPALTCYLAGDVPDPLPLDTTHDEWIAVSLAWLRQADLVLRLSGVSVGADLETAEARRLGIPVYYSVDNLIHRLTE